MSKQTPTTTVTIEIEITGKTVEEVREHFEDIKEEVEAMFEIDLKSLATIERTTITPS